MNRAALGNSEVLGIKTDTHLNDMEYNWADTIYYLSFMIFEYPKNLALQRFPPAGHMQELRWDVHFEVYRVCQPSVDAGFMIISAMFYTRREQTTRIGYWLMMNGAAEIVNDLTLAGDYLRYTDGHCICLLLVPFPGLSHKCVAGVESKHFKEQLIECLTEFKTWIFFFYALSRIHLSIRTASSSSRSALLQTTLLSCINGVIKMTTIFITSRVLLVQFSVETLGAPSGKAWVTQATAAHTKRITVNAMLLIAGSLGNAIGPQMWLDKFATRPHLRRCLGQENGDIIEKRVDKAFLDLTDEQNREFRYVL
ncbi:hypothetical protein ACEPAF_9176 [Sanghuangporus sanghuang]